MKNKGYTRTQDLKSLRRIWQQSGQDYGSALVILYVWSAQVTYKVSRRGEPLIGVTTMGVADASRGGYPVVTGSGSKGGARCTTYTIAFS